MFIDRQNKMHTGARLYKIPLLENKATCKVMNLIKLAHRHLKHILSQSASKHILSTFEAQILYFMHNTYE